MSDAARGWLERIRNLDGGARALNVCGGHERTISMSGMRGALGESIELIPGPGCPVCVCPEQDIFLATQIAMKTGASLLAFGDMLRVPSAVGKNEIRSLEQARAHGASVHPVASPQEAWRLAEASPNQQFVFFVAGFETTIAPVAARIVEGVPDNLQFLISGRRTWPAVKLLLDSDIPGFDVLIAPGHVATVMGPEEWEFIARDYGMPVAISGFAPEHLLHALFSVLQQKRAGRPRLENCYPEAVRPGGNSTARSFIERVFYDSDAEWRGIGTIPESGFELRDTWNSHNARITFPELVDSARKRAGQMPPGCSCAAVVLGKVYPTGCPLYGKACTPRTPVGPCMVSDEGACRVWWSSGHRGEAGAA